MKLFTLIALMSLIGCGKQETETKSKIYGVCESACHTTYGTQSNGLDDLNTCECEVNSP